MLKRTWQTECTVITGPTGTGKSTLVRERFPDAYWKDASKWWGSSENHYDGQEVVVLDEFNGFLPFEEMKRLINLTPHVVEYKGGQTQFLARHIIIISNYEPITWWSQLSDLAVKWPHMERRLHNHLIKEWLTAPVEVFRGRDLFTLPLMISRPVFEEC